MEKISLHARLFLTSCKGRNIPSKIQRQYTTRMASIVSCCLYSSDLGVVLSKTLGTYIHTDGLRDATHNAFSHLHGGA